MKCTGIFLCVIEIYVPNNRKDDSDEKEDQSRYENTAVVLLFGFAHFPLTVIGIPFVLCPSHRDKGEHHVAQYESDTDEGTFAADIQHTCKKRHQYTRNEERVGQDLDIDGRAVRKKAF